MAPDGNIYMPENLQSPDYSKTGKSLQGIFMHEMTHVWQKHSGRSPRFEAMEEFIKRWGNYKSTYGYGLPDDVQDFGKLNLEQQSRI